MNLQVRVLNKHKILWLFNQKVASTSIKNFILLKLNYKIFKPKTLFIGSNKITDFKDYKRIILVRNPLERLKDCYLDDNLYNEILNKQIDFENGYVRDLTFEQFIDFVIETKDKNCHDAIKSQTYYFNKFNPTNIIKLEDFSGWDNLFDVELPFINLNENKGDVEINEEIINKIKERYKNDYKLLNY
jgi:hypothetical protein